MSKNHSPSKSYDTTHNNNNEIKNMMNEILEERE